MDLVFAIPLPNQAFLIQKCCLKPTFGLNHSFLSKKEITLTLTLTPKFHIKGQSFRSRTIHFQKIILTLFFGIFESKLVWTFEIPRSKIRPSF